MTELNELDELSKSLEDLNTQLGILIKYLHYIVIITGSLTAIYSIVNMVFQFNNPFFFIYCVIFGMIIEMIIEELIYG